MSHDTGTVRGPGHRPGPDEHTAAARRVLLTPDDPGTLPVELRITAAARAAERTGQHRLAARYRAMAPAAVPAPASAPVSAAVPAALAAAVVDFTDRVTLDPAGTGPTTLRDVTVHGLDAPAVVALAQICAFVAYEARVASGLALLAGGPAAEPEPEPVREPAAGSAPQTAPLPAAPHAPEAGRFTLNRLTWRPRVPAVDADALTEAQRAVIDAHPTLSAASPYYRTLLHDPAALDHRTYVYDAIMYGRGGLPRAERELATLLVSRVNGCVYCASVHGRKYAQLVRDEAAALRVLDRGGEALAGDVRGTALARFTEAQTRTPPAATGQDVAALRAAGFDDAELTGLVHAVALFGWANRLMLVLGDAHDDTQADVDVHDDTQAAAHAHAHEGHEGDAPAAMPHPARTLDAGIPRTDARESCSRTSVPAPRTDGA
ncbi:peroxidase-related enzyme [Streptomyces sp. NPDC093109]|uniref:peroxidase-related enzyme n=1 Tax=Streptomyces sp. NPDC093109 TaxID=3154977 RepID=UPI0034509045